MLDSGDTDVTQYAWDARNRLLEVIERAAAGGVSTLVVHYYYDVEDRWLGESIDSNGDGQIDHATRFAYDGTQIVLQFDKDVSGVPGSADALTGADRSHHYLWQPDVVDQLMADEPTHLDSGNIVTDELLWALTDQQGTVRDLARSDGTTTSVVNHIVYESFGTIVSQSDSTQGTLFGFTGRPLDTATGLQNNWHRVYDSIIGGWLSTDPLSFTAGDTNTSRYVDNSPTNATDPSGLAIVVRKAALEAVCDYLDSHGFHKNGSDSFGYRVANNTPGIGMCKIFNGGTTNLLATANAWGGDVEKEIIGGDVERRSRI